MSSDQAPRFFLLKHRLSKAESDDILGRVVKSFPDPTFDYTPVSQETSSIIEKYILDPQYDDSAALQAKASQDERFSVRIKNLLTLSTNSGYGGITTIKSPRVVVRRLKLERDYFNELKALPAVRSKILDMCPMNSRTAYLVVGTMSIKTAEFKQTGETHKNTTLDGSLPLLQIAATASGVPLVGSTGSVGVGAENLASAKWTRTFKTPDNAGGGEEVFAISYKEVSRDWLGLGSDVRMKAKQVEYRGGQHFGSDDDVDSDEAEDDDEAENAAVEGVQLSDGDLLNTVTDPKFAFDSASGLSLSM